LTQIQWTDETWNPIAGCSKISEGCRNCYAVPHARRLAAIGAGMDNPGRLAGYSGLVEKGNWTGIVNFIPDALPVPFRWRKPRKVFVNSMSDLFHWQVEDDWIYQILAVVALTPRHTYQVLTKRPDRMLDFFAQSDFQKKLTAAIALSLYSELSDQDDVLRVDLAQGQRSVSLQNLWLGVTAENQKAADERIPLLLQCPAAKRFLSCEPLLGPIDLSDFLPVWTIGGVEREVWPDWVIVGGESGSQARECNIDHIARVVEQCKKTKVPVFVKQLGARPHMSGLPVKISDRKGAIVSEWPMELQQQYFPVSK